MDKNVFIYWTGYEYKLIKILRNLIYLHSKNGNGYNIIFINDNNIKSYIKEIPTNFDILCPAHKADFIRVTIINEYGGIWLDSDTLVIDKLDSLFSILENNEGFFFKDHDGIINNGVFGSKKNTPLMKEWKNLMMNKLNEKSYKINWCDIGSSLLKYMCENRKELYSNYIIFDGSQNIYPVMWYACVKEFLEKSYDNYKNLIRVYQPLVVLVNSVYKNIDAKEENEIFNGNFPLTYFINKSIENAKIFKNLLNNEYSIFNYGPQDYISNSIIKYKCWEPNITNIFESIIKNSNNCVILDIGCNIGYFSLLSSKYENVSQIISIDGNIQNVAMLNLSCIYNNIKKIKVINTCICDKKTHYKIANQEIVNKNNNIGGLSFKEIENNDDIDKCVNATTLDNVINEYKLNNIDILKIDIEGGEKKALLGLSDTFKKAIIKNIIIEISPCFNDDSEEILNIISKNNYEIYNIPHNEIGYSNDDNMYLQKITLNKISNIKDFLKSIGKQTNVLACLNNNKIIFNTIYENNIWNGNNFNIPLSGPGSSLENTYFISELLDKFIIDYNCLSVTDLGCGDLTWISKTNFFNNDKIKYTGIDVVDSLILSHLKKFNNKKFICEDITKFKNIDNSSLIIIRDVIFHLTNFEISMIFSNIKHKFDFIAITSCKNNINTDTFDKYHFSQKNLHISPFNISQNYLYKIEENKFNRNFYIYKHNDFYNIKL